MATIKDFEADVLATVKAGGEQQFWFGGHAYALKALRNMEAAGKVVIVRMYVAKKTAIIRAV